MIDEAGQVRMEVCSQGRKDAGTLGKMLSTHVRRGSIIHSDGWADYTRLEELGFKHSRVNHSVEFVAEDGTHTRRIESQWRAMRRRLTPGGKRHADLGNYLVEYLWRRDCARSNRDSFESIVMLMRK